MSRRVLITGATGCSGRHLAAHLRESCADVVLGTGRRATPPPRLDGYRPCDLTDPRAAAALVEWARPDVVHHLAGGRGADTQPEAHRRAVDAFENLRAALRARIDRRPVRLLVVGSAAEIGRVPDTLLPVDETVECRPLTAYGAAKHAVVQAALAEPRGGGLDIVVARTFNLVGPGLDERLALGRFAAHVRAARRGAAGVLRCGWLGGRRDLVDVRDAVRAYRLLADAGPPGTIANVCSGTSWRMADLLERLVAIAGVRVEVEAAGQPGADDVADMRGSHRTLSRMTGWQPAIALERSLADMLVGE